MTLHLDWMRPEAPYMPLFTAGLLGALDDAGAPAAARWESRADGHRLVITTRLSVADVAAAIVAAPWPQLNRIPWDGKVGQAIKPMLAAADDPVHELTRLRQAVEEADATAEHRLLDGLVTDAVLDDAGVPSRSRLLRGVKADLSGLTEKVRVRADALAQELSDGPLWRNGKSGRGLGFVPEVQTFGGTTGRTPSDVGSHSILLYRLLWLGLLQLPPVGILWRGRRVVGGPLVTNGETLSWPIWEVPLDLVGLRAMYCSPAIHEDAPDSARLAGRGIAAVYRAPAVPINSMIAVFRWGERVA